MQWGVGECYVDEYQRDGIIATIPHPATLTFEPGWHLPPRVTVLASQRTWDQLLAHHIAEAYRPEGVFWWA